SGSLQSGIMHQHNDAVLRDPWIDLKKSRGMFQGIFKSFNAIFGKAGDDTPTMPTDYRTVILPVSEKILELLNVFNFQDVDFLCKAWVPVVAKDDRQKEQDGGFKRKFIHSGAETIAVF